MIYINLLTVLDLYIVYCSGSNIYLYIYTVYIYKSSFLVSQLLEVQIFTLRAGWDDFFFIQVAPKYEKIRSISQMFVPISHDIAIAIAE